MNVVGYVTEEPETASFISLNVQGTGYASFVGFSPDGKKVITSGRELGGTESIVRIWDAESGEELQKLEGHTSEVIAVAFSQDGEKILTAAIDPVSRNVITRVWNVESGEEMQKSEVQTGHFVPITFSPFAAFSPGGKRVITASNGCDHTDRVNRSTTRIWDAMSEEELHKLEWAVRQGETAWAVNFSPDGSKVVIGINNTTAQIWDAELKNRLQTMRGHRHTLRAAVFSPDGKKVVTSSGFNDNTARIWDAESGKQLHILEGHKDDVVDAAFSPDGKKVVTASFDGTARIWDVESGKEIQRLHTSLVRMIGSFSPPQINWVKSVAFSPDGSKVATVSRDGGVRIWTLE